MTGQEKVTFKYSELERFELTTFVVIGTDCIGTQVVVNPTKIRYRPRRPPLLRDASYMFKATLYSELLNRGDLMGRFDCIYKKYLIQHGILSRYRCDILYGCSLL
jgi:hypothetical protein